MVNIQIEIDCKDKMCGDCKFKSIHSTGLIGETHPVCVLFHNTGDWGKTDMKRGKECIAAQKKAMKKEKKNE